jgi:CHAD domain-containing protein
LPSFDDARAGLVADAKLPVVLRSVYYDTEDRRLLAAGITVRRRTRAGATTWDLKVPSAPGDTSVRSEVSLADRSAALPARLAEVLLAWTGGDPLEVVATLRTRRMTWSVVDASGAEVAEVVDDEVEQLDGRRVVARFREVEVERRGVGEAYVRRLAKRLAKSGASPSPGVKLARVVAVPPVPAARRLRKNDPVAALLADALRRATADLLAADVGVRLGEADAIHQLRVATRRMRSDLRAFGTALEPEWGDHLVAELAWLGRSLGAARDAEVVAGRIAVVADDLGSDAEPVVTDLVARSARGADEVRLTLADPRYVALVRLLRTSAASPPVAAGGGRAARETAVDVVDAAWRDLERAVRKVRGRGGEDRVWHAVRINAKRARYTAETAVPVVGAEAARLARAAAAVQDVLGTFHDTTMTRLALAEVAADRVDDSAYGVVAGRLIEREAVAADVAKARLGPVWRGKAEPALRRWRRR